MRPSPRQSPHPLPQFELDLLVLSHAWHGTHVAVASIINDNGNRINLMNFRFLLALEAHFRPLSSSFACLVARLSSEWGHYLMNCKATNEPGQQLKANRLACIVYAHKEVLKLLLLIFVKTATDQIGHH